MTRRAAIATSLAAALLLALVTVCGIVLADSQSNARSDLALRYEQRAELTAALTQAVLSSSSSMSRDENAKTFGAPRPSSASMARVARRNRSANLALLDSRGAIIAKSPNTSAAAARALGARPEYVERALRGEPVSLSDVLRFDRKDPVIEFARSLETPHGRRVMVSGFDARLLSAFIGGYLGRVPNPGGHSYLIDSNGAVVGSPERDAKPGAQVPEPGLVTALAKKPKGELGNDYFVSGSFEVAPWRVVLTAPENRLFASVTGVRRWLPWVLIAAFTLAAGFAFLLQLRGLRRGAELRRSEERYELAVRGASDAIWDRDFTSERLYLSPRWREILGITGPVTESPREWLDRVHPDDLAPLEAAVQAHFDGKAATFEHEHRMRHSDGDHRWMLVRGVAIRDADGHPTRMAGSMSDITARKLAEQQLRQDALYDSLTGLANRNLFLDRLTMALARLRRTPDRSCAVLFLDVDRFKLINDSFTHTVGDELLVELGQRLTVLLRPGDTVARPTPEETVARLGGDEFTILLPEIVSPDDADLVAERILRAIEEPFHLGNRRIFVSASVGIAVGGADATAAEMMRNADLAMYDAKRHGKARASVYSADMHDRVTGRVELETTLRAAIDERRLRVFYQPIVDLSTGRLSGLEALARWPAGLPEVEPEEFIPIAEETGLIGPLGHLVLDTACAQLADWRERGVVGPDVTISVNVAGSQLNDSALLIDNVTSALAVTGLPPEALRLELTERTIIHEPERVRGALRELEAFGVRANIDDFGTGYSSLTFLRYFPGDTLKIDRSFISSMHEKPDHQEIVRAIVALAHNLGLTTVAEGITDPAQIELLGRFGCEHGQGFLFSKPLAADAIETLLATWPDSATPSLPALSR